jgi:hypothetical protein
VRPYCSTRDELQRRYYALVSRHAVIARLLTDVAATGKNGNFQSGRMECCAIHDEATRLRKLRDAHRAEHGC